MTQKFVGFVVFGGAMVVLPLIAWHAVGRGQFPLWGAVTLIFAVAEMISLIVLVRLLRS